MTATSPTPWLEPVQSMQGGSLSILVDITAIARQIVSCAAPAPRANRGRKSMPGARLESTLDRPKLATHPRMIAELISDSACCRYAIIRTVD